MLTGRSIVSSSLARCFGRADVRYEALMRVGHIWNVLSVMGHFDFDRRPEINRITREDPREGLRHLLIRQRVIGRNAHVQGAYFNPSGQGSTPQHTATIVTNQT